MENFVYYASIICSFLFLVSEFLGGFKKVEANSVYQFLKPVIKFFAEKIFPRKIESKEIK